MSRVRKDMVIGKIRTMTDTDLAVLQAIAIAKGSGVSGQPLATDGAAIRNALDTHKAKFENVTFSPSIWGTPEVDEAEAVEIRNAAAVRRQELLNTQLAAAIRGVTAAGALTSLSALSAASPDDIRTELHAKQSLLGVDFTPGGVGGTINQTTISDTHARTLAQLAQSRNQELHEAAIVAAIKNVANPTDLDNITSKTTAQEIREALSKNPALGNIDFTSHDSDAVILSDAQATGAILTAAKEKKQELYTAQIIAAIQKITVETQLDSLTNLTSPFTAQQVRQALSGQAAFGGVNFAGHDTDDFIITDHQANEIQAAAVAQRAAITAGTAATAAKLASNEITIRAAIDAIADPKLLEALAQVADGTSEPDTAKAIRTQLNTARANLGNIDLSTGLDNESVLTNRKAIDIRLLAIQRRNELLLTQFIASADDRDAAELKAIAEFRGTPTATRAFIATTTIPSRCGVSLIIPTTTGPHKLTDPQTTRIQELARQRYNELKLAEAIRNTKYPDVLDEIVAATAEQARRQALDRKPAFGGLDISASDKLTAEALERLQKLAVQRQTQLKAQYTKVAGTVMEVDSVLDNFVDEKVTAGGSASATLKAAAVASSISGTYASPTRASYKGVELRPGETIQSRIKFTVPSTVSQGRSAKEIVGHLIQDHTGTVTDVTKEADKLDDKQKALLAVKQAHMLLTNYPGTGHIILRGGDPEQAARVYAALTYLKASHPRLKDIRIESHVPGFEDPSKGMFYNAGRFIAKKLTKLVSSTILEQEKEQVRLLMEGREERTRKVTELTTALESATRSGRTTVQVGSQNLTLDQIKTQIENLRLHEGEKLQSTVASTGVGPATPTPYRK